MGDFFLWKMPHFVSHDSFVKAIKGVNHLRVWILFYSQCNPLAPEFGQFHCSSSPQTSPSVQSPPDTHRLTGGPDGSFSPEPSAEELIALFTVSCAGSSLLCVSVFGFMFPSSTVSSNQPQSVSITGTARPGLNNCFSVTDSTKFKFKGYFLNFFLSYFRSKQVQSNRRSEKATEFAICLRRPNLTRS